MILYLDKIPKEKLGYEYKILIDEFCKENKMININKTNLAG